ncbi:MAG: hypothetical protein E7080_09720 [Bacteroidales bacterium]|nr:hypothetical protein [Bacteroidales bacterium]
MPLPATINVCQTDLFTSEKELRAKYDEITVQRVLRIRDLYSYVIANPDTKDRQFVERAVSMFKVSQSCAYNDLAIIKSLLPMLSKASRDFHRWRANEMLLETYRMAKARKDTKTMERAASSYAKYNRVDLEEELLIPYDEIVVQPFTATDDPTPLGIKPIPNIQERIKKMVDKYIAESIDIQDVEFEEYDLEEDELFGDLDDDEEER